MRPERVTFANARGLHLVGHLWAGSGAGAVVMAHGFCSNKSSRGRFDRLGPALAEAGFDALAFDFAGCGESDDDTLVIAKQAEDVTAAVGFMAARGMAPIALHGHSLGARACLRAAPGIATMVLTGAGTGPVRYDWTRFFSPVQLADFEAKGETSMIVDDGWRHAVRIERRLIEDFEDVDQAALLRRVRCPVLLIHGGSEADEEERMLLALSRRGLPLLPRGSRLEVIDGAGHGLDERYDDVIRLAVDWYRARGVGPGKKTDICREI
jgi:pimeloyl-ACP methyl ester carboxylesterase